MPRPLPTWPVAFGSFVLGFAVADVTGVRPLGGLVLLAGVLWCLPRWWRGASPAVAICPSPPASETAAQSSALATRARPPCTMGSRMPS